MSTMELRTKFPLSMDDLKLVIANPDLKVIGDYKACQIKDRALLIYLSNINVANVYFEKSNSIEDDFFSLIDSYVTFKSTIDLVNIKFSIVRILAEIKGIELSEAEQQILDTYSLISRERVRDYLEDADRMNNMLRLIVLLDSIPTFIYTCSKEFRDLGSPPEAHFSVVDDMEFTGFTFVNLLKMPMFYINYFGTFSTTTAFYFKPQFEEFFYNGKNLFAETMQSSPELYAVVGAVLKKAFTEQQIDLVGKELDRITVS
tara:strand:+ start:41814 stop:42590 length:777 start_codon:yes stop_codon:yes gene_type:complete